MTDNPTFDPKLLSTLGRPKQDRRKVHCQLNGLCARWVNISIDWAIYLGLWAVAFIEKDGIKTELVSQFSTAVWIRYVSLMIGKPTFKSNAARKIFRYLLANPREVAKTWRGRIYFYSSGTIFHHVSADIRKWLKEDPRKHIPMFRKAS